VKDIGIQPNVIANAKKRKFQSWKEKGIEKVLALLQELVLKMIIEPANS
jgi:hypothetical protein